MHDIRLIRDDPAAFDAALARRGLDPLAQTLVSLDERRRAAVSALQDAQERRNALSKEIGSAKKARDDSRAAGLMAEVQRLKDFSPELQETEKAASAALDEQLAGIPNSPGPEVPEGRDETGNVLLREWGTPVKLTNPKQHFELGESWRVDNGTAMDFDAAAKLSGSRFVVLRGQLARLERALGQFMLDLHTSEHGYTEVSPPLMVRDDAMFGTAQLPKFEDDQFRVPTGASVKALQDARLQALANSGMTELEFYSLNGLELTDRIEAELKNRTGSGSAGEHWLIPTAEVPLTNLVRESILSEDELPLRFTALTPCFRAEAGAAGRDTRGMLRQHQFTKCELVSITTPEASAAEHERMLGCAEAVLQKLELPYRVMTLCTGDMGFAAAKTWDIEVWMPGQATFREISSCSICNDFQARRMNARYRPKGVQAGGFLEAPMRVDEKTFLSRPKNPAFVHTLNGSGVAVGRALIAVLENYQQPDGSVTVPAVLRTYMGGLDRIGTPS